MKRLPALLALVVVLVLVLMLGTAGMASATTLNFEFDDPSVSPAQLAGYPYIPPAGSPIASVTMINWHNEGGYNGGHLYCNNCASDNVIYFAQPTYVESFQVTGLPYPSYDPNETAPYPGDPNFILFGPVTISAFSGDNPVPVWSTTVDFLASPPDGNSDFYTFAYNWLTVPVNTADVTKIIFYGSNPLFNEEGPIVYPSIDNLVITEAPVPASVWLLVSGLAGLVGLRRKFTC